MVLDSVGWCWIVLGGVGYYCVLFWIEKSSGLSRSIQVATKNIVLNDFNSTYITLIRIFFDKKCNTSDSYLIYLQ